MSLVVNAVSRRYRKALSGATLSAAAFESITVSASPERVEAWSAEEEYAQRERGRDVKVMDIYDIKRKQCGYDYSMKVLPDIRFQSHRAQKYFLS